MNKHLSFVFTLPSLFCAQTQTAGPNEKGFNNAPAPARVAPTQMYRSGEERVDYVLDRGSKGQFVWSIRDRNWVPMPTSLFGFTYNGRLIKGPRVLRPGITQEYVLGCVSQHKGTPKYLWVKEPGLATPYKLGEIYSDDEVEIEWEIRTSPGVRVIAEPELPSKLRYWEPLAAPFKIEVGGDSVQRVEIYANGYRAGKLIGFSWIPLIINPEGYSEAKEHREKKEWQDLKQSFASTGHTDWRIAPWIGDSIKTMQHEFEQRHRLTKQYQSEGLRSGEFLTDTEDLDKR